MAMKELGQAVAEAAKKLYGQEIEPELTRPDEQFGDYSTNVAMQLAKEVGKNPREIAEALVGAIKSPLITKAEVAGPGFINFWLSDEALLAQMDAKPATPLATQEILVEFGDPNPFKEMHIGHLYSYVAGESLCRLLEGQGATVRRLSYHGDVGLHVAKAIWGMQQGSATSIGEYYQKGAQAYEEDPAAKAAIDEINEHIYAHDNPEIEKLYQQGKDQSFKEFDKILELLNIKTDKRYLESDSTESGIGTVKANIGKVFEQSEGAVVYKGEQDGLHTRVFLTSRGLPTYETKDLGLAELKAKDYPQAARSIIVTAHEQAEYFKVMLAALAKIQPELAAKTTHLYHGFVNLSSGKMSSRKGQVFTAGRLLNDVAQEVKKSFEKPSPEVEQGAIKYGFLKHRLGSDIAYDPAESVSLEGNSGPYLQYAYARANSIVGKAKSEGAKSKSNKLEPGERSLARKIGEYSEVAEQAAAEMLPSHICTYLYELAQAFNRFYESNRVIDDKRQAIRLELVRAYTKCLKSGLELLNIPAPERM